MARHRGLAEIALAVLCLPVTAQDMSADIPYSVEGMVPWGRVTRVMEPDYPTQALSRKISGFVDIVGRLNSVGVLEDVEYTPGSDDAKLMVEPLSKVMHHWLFSPFTDNDCQPAVAVVQNRVWFDLEGDKPKMSVAVLRRPNDRPQSQIKVVHRVEPTFPQSMQRMGWQSDVFALVVIDPAGTVLSVDATARPKQRRVNLEAFENEVRDSLMKWRFRPSPGAVQDIRACYRIHFRLKD